MSTYYLSDWTFESYIKVHHLFDVSLISCLCHTRQRPRPHRLFTVICGPTVLPLFTNTYVGFIVVNPLVPMDLPCSVTPPDFRTQSLGLTYPPVSELDRNIWKTINWDLQRRVWVRTRRDRRVEAKIVFVVFILKYSLVILRQKIFSMDEN